MSWLVVSWMLLETLPLGAIRSMKKELEPSEGKNTLLLRVVEVVLPASSEPRTTFTLETSVSALVF